MEPSAVPLGRSCDHRVGLGPPRGYGIQQWQWAIPTKVSRLTVSTGQTGGRHVWRAAYDRHVLMY